MGLCVAAPAWPGGARRGAHTTSHARSPGLGPRGHVKYAAWGGQAVVAIPATWCRPKALRNVDMPLPGCPYMALKGTGGCPQYQPRAAPGPRGASKPRGVWPGGGGGRPILAISTTWWGQNLCEVWCVLAWPPLHAAKGHRKVPTPLALHDAWAPWGLEAAHSVAWGWGGAAWLPRGAAFLGGGHCAGPPRGATAQGCCRGQWLGVAARGCGWGCGWGAAVLGAVWGHRVGLPCRVQGGCRGGLWLGFVVGALVGG